MFGLTFEKLLLLAIIAGIVIGPHNLPVYAQKFAGTVRSLRAFIEATRSQAESEMGVSLQRADWDALNLRQYDPRRIVREVLDETASTTPSTPDMAQTTGTPLASEPAPVLMAEASRVRPGQKYIVTGSASHPVRIRIDSLPLDDPRRIAARGGSTTGVPETREAEPHT